MKLQAPSMYALWANKHWVLLFCTCRTNSDRYGLAYLWNHNLVSISNQYSITFRIVIKWYCLHFLTKKPMQGGCTTLYITYKLKRWFDITSTRLWMKSASLSALVMWSREMLYKYLLKYVFWGKKKNADSNKDCDAFVDSSAVCLGHTVQAVLSLSDCLWQGNRLNQPATEVQWIID